MLEKLFNRKSEITPEQKRILAQAEERIAAEKKRIEQEERRYRVLVEDPLDFDGLVLIGKKVGADILEVQNKEGTIFRFYFKTNQTEVTTKAEEEAIKAGLW
jgi:hypothetical protein